MDKVLERQLFEKLEETYYTAVNELKYHPTRFLSSLHEDGAIATAISHIEKGPQASGLQKLYFERRLDISVEAVVLTGPWKNDFPLHVISKARRTLKDFGFSVKEYLGNERPVEVAETANIDTHVQNQDISKPETRETTSNTFVRDTNIINYCLRNAKGICEFCGHQGPFRGKDGQPYLVVHHVKPLGEGGSDRIENAAAVCPNCHSGFHHAEDAAVRTDKLYNMIKRLVRE